MDGWKTFSFPFEKPYFQVQTVSFRECTVYAFGDWCGHLCLDEVGVEEFLKSTLSLGKINTNFPKSTFVVQRTRSVSVHHKTSVKGRKDVKNKQTTHFHEEKMRNKTR